MRNHRTTIAGKAQSEAARAGMLAKEDEWRLWKMSARSQTEGAGEGYSTAVCSAGVARSLWPAALAAGLTPERTAGTVFAITGCTRLPDADAIPANRQPLASSQTVQLYPVTPARRAVRVAGCRS